MRGEWARAAQFSRKVSIGSCGCLPRSAISCDWRKWARPSVRKLLPCPTRKWLNISDLRFSNEQTTSNHKLHSILLFSAPWNATKTSGNDTIKRRGAESRSLSRRISLPPPLFQSESRKMLLPVLPKSWMWTIQNFAFICTQIGRFSSYWYIFPIMQRNPFFQLRSRIRYPLAPFPASLARRHQEPGRAIARQRAPDGGTVVHSAPVSMTDFLTWNWLLTFLTSRRWAVGTVV